LEPDDLSYEDQKACCKAIHALIVRSEKKGKQEGSFDQEIFNCFLAALSPDKTDNLMATFSLLNDGFSSAMTQVVINPLRNTNLFVERPPSLRALPLRDDTTKPKDSPSPSPNPRSKPKESSSTNSKKDPKRKSESPHPRATNKHSSAEAKESKEEEKPLCPGCGVWLSEKHTTDNCQWILQNKKGYNENWKSTPWKESSAAAKQKE
jgi:hypothetical protein